MRCHHFDAGECRSCAFLPTPYLHQVAAKQAAVSVELGLPPRAWLPPVVSAEAGCRNKAKMVATGSANELVLTLPAGAGEPEDQGGAAEPVDLADCPLYPEALRAVFPAVRALVRRAQVAPYDVERRRGELKHVVVTCAPAGDLMVRFVLRTEGPVPRLREHLGLLTAHPGVRVVSCNVQPEHAAVLEGPEEHVLTAESALPMPVGDLTLYLRPRSFFQTNTAVATALYRQVGAWADAVSPGSVLDLYCGVGGFALHTAGLARRVLGVEISDEAIVAARRSAAEAGIEAEFSVGDATTAGVEGFDLVVVNPPRRGIGESLAARLDAAGPRHVVYSSCNPVSLAADLRAMPNLQVREARLFDMFPHTEHAEVAVLLERR